VGGANPNASPEGTAAGRHDLWFLGRKTRLFFRRFLVAATIRFGHIGQGCNHFSNFWIDAAENQKKSKLGTGPRSPPPDVAARLACPVIFAAAEIRSIAPHRSLTLAPRDIGNTRTIDAAR